LDYNRNKQYRNVLLNGEGLGSITVPLVYNASIYKHDGSLIRIESEWYILPLSKVKVETKVYDVLFKEVWCSRGTCFVAKRYRQC